MKKLALNTMAATSLALTACGDKAGSAVEEEQAATTTVTEENYGLAETQTITAGYVEKLDYHITSLSTIGSLFQR